MAIRPGQLNRSVGNARRAQTQNMASDYQRQLQNFGTDYAGAQNFANQYLQQNKNQFGNAGNAEAIRKANEGYFKNWQVNPDEDNYDSWRQRQNLMYRRNYTANPMMVGGAYGAGMYSKQANAKALQAYQKMQAGNRATKFAEDLPNYISGETNSLQSALRDKYNQSKQSLLAEMNRRGLLSSGQRGLKEANLSADIAGEFEQGRADIYKQAEQKAQDLFTNPLLKNSSYQGRLMDLQNQIQARQAQEGAARSALFGAGAGLIGEGIGNYFGKKE